MCAYPTCLCLSYRSWKVGSVLVIRSSSSCRQLPTDTHVHARMHTHNLYSPSWPSASACVCVFESLCEGKVCGRVWAITWRYGVGVWERFISIGVCKSALHDVWVSKVHTAHFCQKGETRTHTHSISFPPLLGEVIVQSTQWRWKEHFVLQTHNRILPVRTLCYGGSPNTPSHTHTSRCTVTGEGLAVR